MRVGRNIAVLMIILALGACDMTRQNVEQDERIRGRIVNDQGQGQSGAMIVIQHEISMDNHINKLSRNWITVEVNLEQAGHVYIWVASYCDTDTISLLVDDSLAAGRYFVQWQGRDAYERLVSDGVYWVHIETPEELSRRPVICRNSEFGSYSDTTGLRPLAITDYNGEFIISQACLPLDQTVVVAGVREEPDTVAKISRRVKVWGMTLDSGWAQSNWVFVDEQSGADVELLNN